MSEFTVHGGSDVTSSAARASLTDRSAVSDKAATLSLDEQLERAERDLVCAEMIDNYSRMIRETDAARARIRRIKAAIADRDARSEREHIEDAVLALGDRCAR